MLYVALGLSVSIAALGALGVASPPRLLSVLRLYETRGGLYTAAAVRLLLGASMLVVASTSRAPELIRVFGVLAVVAGVTTPFFGVERVGKIMAWWSSRPPMVLRAWAGSALALGVCLVWAVAP